MSFEPSNKYYYSKNDFLNYQELGQGTTTLIFLHGFGASHINWTDIIKYLPKDRFRIFLFDLIGSGFSSKPQNSDYSILANAAIIVNFIKDKNIKNYIVIGHSFGGGVALFTSLQLIKKDLSKPKAMILLDAAAYKTELPFFVEYLRIPVISNFLLFLTSAEYQASYTLNRIFYNKKKVTADLIKRYSFFNKLDGYNYALIKTAEQIIPENFEQYTDQYQNISIPTLVLWGKHDPALPLSSGKRLVAQLPNAHLEIIDRCGHNPQEERPEKATELMLSFINNFNG